MSQVTGTADLLAEDVRVPGGRARFLKDLGRIATLAAGRLGRPVYLSVCLVDDTAMARHNRELLGHEGPTDVISLAMNEAPVLEGELLISVDTATREAEARGHPAYHELVLYAVHGVQHLLGHDDHDPDDRRRMRRAERRMLAELGLPPVYGRGGTSQGLVEGT